MIRRFLAAAAVAAAVVGWFLAPPAAAHDATTTARATATAVDEDVAVVLELEYDLLMKSAWLYAGAYRATDRGEQLRQLARHEAAVSAYAVDRFQVALGEQRCTGRAAGPADVTERAGRAYAVLTVHYDCPSGAGGQHALYSALFPDQEGFVHDTRTLLRYDVDGESGSAVLTTGDPRHDVAGAGDHAAVTPAAQSHGARLWDFGLLGAEHLVLGPDHLLFLLALLIGARGWRDVVLSATAFTAAHSVTFALGSLGLVSVPATVVEPLIAASIVVVAALGVRGARRPAGSATRWRVPIAFGFGLLHGLGFAGALGIEQPGSWELVASLLAFNVGIEVAQLALVVVAFPLLLALRRAAVGPRLITGVTVAVALVGTFWLLQRLPLTGELMARALAQPG